MNRHLRSSARFGVSCALLLIVIGASACGNTGRIDASSVRPPKEAGGLSAADASAGDASAVDQTPGIQPSKGTIPPEATRSDGSFDRSKVPDFIAVGDSAGGIAGYARFEELFFGEPSSLTKLVVGEVTYSPIAVFGEDLRTVVGHLHSRRGFVPLGVDPATLPTITVVTAEKQP